MTSTEIEIQPGRIRGTERDGVVTFRGIPYAAPPEGARRFLPPEPVAPWSEVRDATRPGPSAPHLAMPALNWINAAAGPLDEDCLSLNVWAPSADGEKRPVLFWIHGGAFVVGSGTTPIYDGADLARKGDVVVVTINYRLGAIGFSHLATVFPDELPTSSNLGLRDQIAALEWVRDNIDRFGGDAENVTVFGQSAGGMSTGALLGAPRARALMNRAICMSGAADNVLSFEQAQQVADHFLEGLGGPSPNPTILGRIPLEEVLAAQNRTMTELSDLRSMMMFEPCVDGDLIPEHPLEALRKGAAKDIPIMSGATLDEWKLFGMLDAGLGRFDEGRLHERFGEVLDALPGAPSPSQAARDYRAALGERSATRRDKWVWHAFQSARVFHWPATRLSEAQRAGGGQAHNYLFTWRPTLARRAIGACHAIDIPFVFGSIGHPIARPLTGLSNEARHLSRHMQNAWLAFARHGEPGHPDLPDWGAYTPKKRLTMIFGRKCEVSEAPLEAERELLASWAAD